jgi:chemotaxis protein methyltransferase CheR
VTEVGPHQLAALSDLLGERLGLRFAADRHTDLERAIARAASDAGYAGSGNFVNHLLAGGMDERRVQALAWHLTVGETYFFRGNSTFAVLERTILPRLIEARRHGSRQLRIWSAGCSSGEEPYSLAILLTRLLPDIDDWRLTILATDINTRSLAKAERGVYSEWSFRDVPASLRSRYFAQTGEKAWTVAEHIKRLVTFSYLNLATDAYPSLATNTTAVDVIFCRNVLMYFQTPTIKSVVGKLHDALVDGGALFVTASEASPEYFPQFRRATGLGEIYFEKKKPDGDGVVPGTRRPRRTVLPAERRAGERVHQPARPVVDTRPAATPVVVDEPSTGADVLVASARQAANEGRLEEARSLCARAIAMVKSSAELRYLHATILDELARPDEAIQALTSALYLDPDLVIAHFLLGNVARRVGRHTLAARHLRRTLELLEGCAPDDQVPAAGDISALDLARIAESLLGMEVTR